MQAFPAWEDVSHESKILQALWSQKEVLLLQNHVLVRRFFGDGNVEQFQIVIPRHMREEIVVMAHEQGHFGVKRTQAVIQPRFYWPFWKSDASKCVAACFSCNRRKGPQSRAKLPLKRYVCSQPMQRVAIDILGQLPTTPRGNRYLLVCTDYFTKWIEAFPLQNQEAETVADALVEGMFSRLGVPAELHADQGRNFESAVLARVCSRLHIVKTRTSPYRPQSDGQTERANRTLLSALAKMCESQNDWDKVTPLVCMFYRATVHASTGTSPASLMLGRELSLPLDMAFPPPIKEGTTLGEYTTGLEGRLQQASELARKHLLMSWDRMQAHSPISRKIPELDLSKPAYVYNPSVKQGYSSKLASFWKGPFPILRRISPHLFKVNMGGRRKDQTMHRSHIFQPST
jgi:transposase InsO family protein